MSASTYDQINFHKVFSKGKTNKCKFLRVGDPKQSNKKYYVAGTGLVIFYSVLM